MPKQIGIFVGSFKPPHKNHLSTIVKTLQYMNKDTNRKYEEKPEIMIFISSKSREPCIQITKETSKEIWKIYISLLPKKYQSQIKLVQSSLPSPTQTAYGFVKNRVFYKDTLYFISDIEDKRYRSIETLCKNKKIQYTYCIFSPRTIIYSSDIQEYLSQKNKKKFYKTQPTKLLNKQKNTIYTILQKLCK